MLLLTRFVHADAPFLQEGKAGFVVAHIAYVLAPDAAETGVCPQGMSLSVRDIFAQTPAGRRRAQETDEDYAKRLQAGGNTFSTATDGQNLCTNPEAGKPDPHFHTMEANDIAIDGIDLDSAQRSGASVVNSCAHHEFTGTHGETGIDNQFARVVGCSRSFQPTGPSNTFATEMLTGSWGILLALSGVDNIVNDDSVQVRFLANADPIQLSPTRDPLAYATYLADPDPGFQATAQGRIENGILTTEPVDMQFHHVVNSMYLTRQLRDARLRATLSDDGTLDGYLAGYTPVEAMYNLQFGFRDGQTRSGEPAPAALRQHSANGAAYVLGYTCNGAYFALQQHADGHPDPQTGQCTTISTQYKIRAIPAFVVASDAQNPDSSTQAAHLDAH